MNVPRRAAAVAALGLLIGLAPAAVAAPAADDPVAALADRLYPALAAGPGLDGADVPVEEFRQPATDAGQLVRQPGGQTVPVRIAPAETGGSLETADGFTVLRGDDGSWRYAVKAPDGRGLQPSDALAGVDPVPAGLQPGLGRREPAEVTPQEEAEARSHTEMLHQMRVASRSLTVAAASVAQPRVFRFPVLMLATWWDSAAGQTGPQFQEGSDTPEHFARLLDGFGGNPTGTLTEFYFEDSFGTFLVEVDVHGPFTSARSQAEDECYYGGIAPGDDQRTDLDLLDDVLGIGGGGALGMAVEALPQADPSVDFSQYDNDSDGQVDFVGIVHSGPDMAVTGDPCHTWSHAIQATLANGIVEGAAGLTPGTLGGGLPTTDGVFVDRLFTMPEFDEPGQVLPIGVATHEMAHALGEPDYYNTTYTSAGTGDHDIMSGGSYGGNPTGSNPTGFNPASRVFQGWTTPTVVNGDLRGYVLQPRHIRPPDYDPARPNPNLLLVPVKEIGVGEVDQTGHEWTENDVYGLAVNPATGKSIIEGYYLENINRTATAAQPIHPEMTRAPYFDRSFLSSGVMAWHFDYHLRSNVLYQSNNAQTDANRPQMDPMEFDYNDNTQELQLNKGRGNAEDLLYSAATGITSGTRLLPPEADQDIRTGPPSEPRSFSGVVVPTQTSDHPFTVEENPNDKSMTVKVAGLGDCTLQLLKDGEPLGAPVDGGFVGAEELVVVNDPQPGQYVARVGDFAACGQYEGSVEFANSSGVLETKGAADTWSNWSKQPTGWAFTNVGPAQASGLDHAADGGGTEAITLDVVNLGADEADTSPGFVTGATTGRAAVGANAGRSNAMTVPVFNNGGKAVPSATVTVREGSRVVAQGSVTGLGAYTRTAFDFSWTPSEEGAHTLVTTVTSSGNALSGNDVQATELWVGPAAPRVLVVDDDGAVDQDVAIAGSLSALGVPYAVVSEHPDAATLASYEAVVWEAGGDRAVGQLDAGDVAALSTYLDGGGMLLLSSNRAVSALAEPPGRTNPGASESGAAFALRYLGAASGGVEPMTKDTELTGTGLLSGPHRLTVCPGRCTLDPIVPSDEARGDVQPLFTSPANDEGETYGVAVTGDSGFRTMTLGYNLSQHATADQTTEVLRRALGFFGVATAAPTVSTVEPVVYHSAVRQAVSGKPVQVRAVVLGGRGDQPVTLHYRRHGKGSYVAQSMVAGSAPGSWHGVIPGTAVTPDGVDYFLKAGRATTYDPPAARDRSVVHAIAVAIPEVASPGGPAAPAPGAPAAVGAGPAPTTSVQGAPARQLPATGGAPLLALGALVLVAAGLVGRRFTRGA
jgi:M6 family metalloprotease-like protein